MAWACGPFSASSRGDAHGDPGLGDRVVDAQLSGRLGAPGVGQPVDPAVPDVAEDDQVAFQHGGDEGAGGGVLDCRPRCWRRPRRWPRRRRPPAQRRSRAARLAGSADAGRLAGGEHVAGARGRRPGWRRRSRARWTPRRRPPARPASPARVGGDGGRVLVAVVPDALVAAGGHPGRGLLGVVVALARRLGAAGLAVAVRADHAAAVGARPGDRDRCPRPLPGRSRACERPGAARSGVSSSSGRSSAGVGDRA